MSYKKWNQNISFADIALSSSIEKNRSLKTMERINRVIDWNRVEERLMDYYEVGRQEEGADAYPPLMLLLPARRAYRPEGRPYCYRSGFTFPLILNWKTRSMIVFLLRSF